MPGSNFLTSITLCNFFKSFTMMNLRKTEITIAFNGNLGHLWDVITHLLHAGVTETFTDILKHYFLQTSFVKFAKDML